MPFSNDILGGEELVRSAMRSQNFEQGPPVVGWRLTRDGEADFGGAVIGGSFRTNGTDNWIEIESDNDNKGVIRFFPEADAITPASIQVDDSISPGEESNLIINSGVPADGTSPAATISLRTIHTIDGDSLIELIADRIRISSSVGGQPPYLQFGLNDILFSGMQQGTTSVTTNNNTVQQAISFPFSFVNVPRVMLLPRSSVPDRIRLSTLPGSITTSGFTLVINRTGDAGSTNTSIDWIAIAS